jgi:hypothetical protein
MLNGAADQEIGVPKLGPPISRLAASPRRTPRRAFATALSRFPHFALSRSPLPIGPGLIAKY